MAAAVKGGSEKSAHDSKCHFEDENDNQDPIQVHVELRHLRGRFTNVLHDLRVVARANENADGILCEMQRNTAQKHLVDGNRPEIRTVAQTSVKTCEVPIMNIDVDGIQSPAGISIWRALSLTKLIRCAKVANGNSGRSEIQF
jgi:hypothetical protein